MTGAEHYETAEKLLVAARDPRLRQDGVVEGVTFVVACAQVHATLALAAAAQHAGIMNGQGYGA